MIYLFSPLYLEAKEIIRTLKLKQETLVKGVSSFVDENVILTLTGTGKVSTATTIASILTKKEIRKEDYIVFFGSAASLKDNVLEKLYQIHKITDIDTGRSYYPDLLYKTNCSEGTVLTGSTFYGIPMKRDIPEFVDLKNEFQKEKYKEYDFYDMESSAVFQSASKFVSLERVLIFRFPSDTGEEISKEEFERKAIFACKELLPVLEILKNNPTESSITFSKDALDILEEFSSKLHCTISMRNELMQYIRYAELSGKDWKSLLSKQVEEVTDKEMGKKVLKKYEEQLL